VRDELQSHYKPKEESRATHQRHVDGSRWPRPIRDSDLHRNKNRRKQNRDHAPPQNILQQLRTIKSASRSDFRIHVSTMEFLPRERREEIAEAAARRRRRGFGGREQQIYGGAAESVVLWFTEGESCRFMAALRRSEREERLGLRRQAVKMARRGSLDGPDLFMECAGWIILGMSGSLHETDQDCGCSTSLPARASAWPAICIVVCLVSCASVFVCTIACKFVSRVRPTRDEMNSCISRARLQRV
jgi:hypothetical protein